MSDTVVLNLTAEEASSIYWEIKRQEENAGLDNTQDLRPIRRKLERQREKFIPRTLDSGGAENG